MKRTRLPLVMALFLGAAGASAPRAAAAQASPDDAAQAQALFDEAFALMNKGKYADACPKLEASQRLDPGMGTQFRLAECYERMWRLARAWALFLEVAEAAKRENRLDREKQARQRADAIRPRVPSMTIVVPPAVASLTGFDVTQDGTRVPQADWGRGVPVDPGEHVIEATAPGKKTWRQKVAVAEGGVAEVTIPALAVEEPGSAGSSTPPGGATSKPLRPEVPVPGPDEPKAGSGQRTAATIATVVGAGGLIAGGALGLLAKMSWDDTLTHCKGGDPARCSPEAVGLQADASRWATLSTVGFAVGGVGLVTAGILWLTAPSSSEPAAKAGVRIVPVVGGEGFGGAVMHGRF